jgi:GAF domain-containing protein
MVKVFGVDQGGVVILNSPEGYEYTVAEYPQVKKPKPPMPLHGNTAVEWIFNHKRPLVIEEATHDPGLVSNRRVVKQWGTQSRLLVPLLVRNEVIGTISLDVINARRGFSEEEVKLAETMATQVATAIENAQLYEQAQNRVDMLKVLYEAGRVVTSSLDLDEILNRIVKQAWHLTKYQGKKNSFACIRLIEGMTSQRVAAYPQDKLVKAHEPCKKEVDLRIGINGQIGIMGRAALKGESQLVNNVMADPDYLECNSETRSELAVPIKVDNQVFGVISIQHADYNAFNREDQYALEALATHAAIAITNAKTYRDLKQQERYLRAVYEAGKATLGTLNQKEMLDWILREVTERVCQVDGKKASLATFQMYDPEEETLILTNIYPHDMLANLQIQIGAAISLKASQRIGVTGKVARDRQPQLVADVMNDPDYIIGTPQTRSELSVPVMSGDELLGVLNVEHHRPAAFDEPRKEALQLLADLMGVALKNWDQTKQLERTAWISTLESWGAEIAHHVNREAGAIRRILYLLQQDPRLPEEVKAYLREADGYAGDLVLPMESGPSALADLDKTVKREVARARDRWPELSWQTNLYDGGIRVKISASWLGHLIRHLLHNAADAMPPDKLVREVIVSTMREEAMAIVQVQDTGPGLLPEIKPLVFRQRIEKQKGAGTGLLLVKSAVEQCGGSARLLWSRPDQGVCFELRLPLAPGA